MLAVGATVFFATVAATGLVLKFLRRHAIFDRPNERSSHTELTPRGGGIGVVAILFLAWAMLAPPEHRTSRDRIYPPFDCGADYE